MQERRRSRRRARRTPTSACNFCAVRHDAHLTGRWVDLVAPNAVRPEQAQVVVPGPAPKYGAHTRDILSELGYEAREIDAMIAKGSAAEQWSEKYLPE
ncbi:hypothetical protein [Roseibium album]|uniref:hypothetical protein n=1 Tax=Roseibium album TaxID=311410 RepID=UPI003297CA52